MSLRRRMNPLIPKSKILGSFNLYNGQKILNGDGENFMTELNVMKILINLKIKNCEGFDRIPLRIYDEGAEIVIAPLAKLFKLIYTEKRISE